MNLPELQPWLAVPGLVVTRLKLAADVKARLKQCSKMLPADDGYGYVYWNPEAEAAWAVVGPDATEQTHQAWHNRLQALQMKGGFRVETEKHPPDPDNWIRIKSAAVYDPPIWKASAVENWSPLANTVAGGLLGAGAGAGVGWLADRMLPEEYFDRRSSTLQPTLMAMGAGLGAAPGLIQNMGQQQTLDSAGVKGVSAFTTTPDKMPTSNSDPRLRAQRNLFESGTGRPRPSGSLFKVSAFGEATGLSTVRSIPRDAFNRVVWNDASMGVLSARNNPYGTKNQFGDNSSAMYTPPAAAAAVTGLISGLSHKYESSILSPFQVASGLVNAGIGGATAAAVGTALGALAGLKPERQQQLQSLGVWGGLMQGIANSIFNR